MKAAGKVFLLGAGPGDPGLLTVKARSLLEKADVVIYDRLVNEKILNNIRPEAEVIYVGKESSRHSVPQEGINQVLLDKAREGKMVARLKGGDPFLFGRGGEEAGFLRENDVRFEVVPGVTSAIAAPAYAGIPVTHRDYTSTLTIITGHEKPGKEASSIPWHEVAAGKGTLVFLMGVENLQYIVENLIGYGRDHNTPVALVRWGTYPYQEVLEGTLGTIVEQVLTSGFNPPAVMVVGQVVELRHKLRWFDNRPLFGKRIVVTRAQAQAGRMVTSLENLGAEVVEYPAISIESVAQPELNQKISRFDTYNWLIFTSANGVREFFNRVFDLGFDIRDLKGPRVCAIGPVTAGELEQRGIRVSIIPEEYRAEGLTDALRLKIAPGDRVLLARARGAREVLPQALRALDAEVDVLDLYQAVPAAADDRGWRRYLDEGSLDMITFTSSSTVRNFVALAGAETVAKLQKNTLVACIGPITAETARSEGFRIDIEAEIYTVDGLINAIVNYYTNR